MELFYFNVKGKTSVYKRSDQNGSYTYSYILLTQQALKGMIGAIIGLKGYDNFSGQSDDNSLEFNRVFRELKCGIVPHFAENNFSIYYNTRTNATGLANLSSGQGGKQGASLLLREQWIADVQYSIYLDVSAIEQKYREKLKRYLENEEATYLPYLGRKEHFAQIYNFKTIGGEPLNEKKIVCKSTLPKEDIKQAKRISKSREDVIAFTEMSPFDMDDDLYHLFKEYLYTNQQITLKGKELIGDYYRTEEGVICLY